MSTTKSPAQQLAEHVEASRRETERLQAIASAIDAADEAARAAAELAHYRRTQNPLASEYRERRDALKNKLDELAQASEFDVDELFRVFLELRVEDAKCYSLSIHAARLDYLDPLPPNHVGAARQHNCGVTQLYQAWTWSTYLDSVIKERAEAAGRKHLEALQHQAFEEIKQAGDEARAAAASEQ